MRDDLTTARSLLERALEPVADVGVVPGAAAEAVPFRVLPLRIHVRRPDHEVYVALREWRGSDEPAENDGSTVWVLRRAPADQLSRLRAEGRSFVDVARGVVRLFLPYLFVDLSNVEVPPRSLATRALRDPFGDRASLVSRLLVEQPERTWTARELAETAGVSTMTASHVVRQLRELSVVRVQQRGRAFEVQLADVRRLVEHWAMRYSWRQCARLAVEAPIGSPERFLRRLSDPLGGQRWALTLQSGASLVAPHAAWETIHLYVDVPSAAALREVARDAGWDPGEGRLVLMRPWYAHAAWVGAREVNGLPVVSDLQLILDLWHYPVRGRDQSEQLLELLAGRVEGARAERAAHRGA